MIIEDCEIFARDFEDFPIIPEGGKYPILCQDGKGFERLPTNAILFGEAVQAEGLCMPRIEFFHQDCGPQRKIRIVASRDRVTLKSGIIGFDFCDMIKAVREWQRPDL